MESLTIKDLKHGKAFASDMLRENFNNYNDTDIIINFAYTDYGGTFFDNVCIEYFVQNYPNNIVQENTSWNGKNAILFGNNLVQNFIEQFENYPLGFEVLEDFYYEKESELLESDFIEFIKNNFSTDEYSYNEIDLLNFIIDNCSYNLTSNSVDYNENGLIEYIIQHYKRLNKI